MNINGVLTIRTIQGRNGPFNVGRLITLERSIGRENRVQVIGLIGVMKKFAFTWLVNQTFII